jgi:hypothetical protein
VFPLFCPPPVYFLLYLDANASLTHIWCKPSGNVCIINYAYVP